MTPLGLLVRPRDDWGDGAFHARRDGGNRLHLGVDLVAWPRTPIVAWEHGIKVIREARPYADDPRFGGVYLELGDKRRVKIFYISVAPHIVPALILTRGDVVGLVQDLGARYADITPHIHFELWEGDERVDPSDYLGITGRRA